MSFMKSIKEKRYFYIMVLCMLSVLVGIALFWASVTMPDRSRIFLKSGESYIIYIISGSVLLLSLLFLGYRIITGSSKYRLITGILFGVVILIQFLISRIWINPITDCFTTIDEAIAMLKDHHGLINNNMAYFARYTNNHFFTILMYYYFRIIRHTGMDYFYSAVLLNIVCIDFSVFGCFKITDALFGRKRALGVLFLLALCPTTYLFVSFPYTNTFSMPFITGVLYCGICLMKENTGRKGHILYSVGLIFFSVTGTLIRPTTAIALTAVVIYMFLKKVSLRFFAYTAGILSVIVILLLCGGQFIKMHLANPDNTGGFPATHWVMMGLKDKGEVNSGDVRYTKSFPEKSEKIKANMKVIKERAGNLGVTGMISLAKIKISELWSIGTDSFNAHHSSAVKYTEVYEHIYGNKNGWLMFYCQIFRIAELFMAFILIVRMIFMKDCCRLEPVILTLLGIMVFLMCWETNRKHNICFIPVLVLMMESGFDCCKNVIMPVIKKPAAILGLAVIFITGDILAVAQKGYFTDVNHTVKDYSYFKPATRLKSINNIVSNNKYVEQEFKTYRPFNMITVRFRTKGIKGGDGSFHISLYGKENCLESVTAGINDIDNEGWYYMDCGKNGGSYEEGVYTLRIEGGGGITDSMSPMVIKGVKMHPYRNTQLYVNRRKKNDSLMFYVYNTAERPVTTDMEWLIIFIIALILQMCVICITLPLTKYAGYCIL